MTRKRFIRKLMAMGYSRNQARKTATEMLEKNREVGYENRFRRRISQRIQGQTGISYTGYRARPFSYKEWLTMCPARKA